MKTLQFIFAGVLLYALITGHLAGSLIAAGFILFIRCADRQFDARVKEHAETRDSD